MTNAETTRRIESFGDVLIRPFHLLRWWSGADIRRVMRQHHVTSIELARAMCITQDQVRRWRMDGVHSLASILYVRIGIAAAH